MALALMATVAGLRTFSAGRPVFYRETASGLNRSSDAAHQPAGGDLALIWGVCLSAAPTLCFQASSAHASVSASRCL